MRAASAKYDRTVRTAVRELVRDGVLTREDRPGKSSVFGFKRELLRGNGRSRDFGHRPCCRQCDFAATGKRLRKMPVDTAILKLPA